MKTVIINHSKVRCPRQFITDWMSTLEKELSGEGIENAWGSRPLYLVFLDVKEALGLNKKFRDKNYATDVLSFESVDPESFGELVLCSPVIQEQARQHQLTYRLELGYLLIHGVLHLLGYDHEDDKCEADRMFAIQDKAFESLCRKFSVGKKKR